MVNAFGQTISETYQAVSRALEVYRTDATRENAIALYKACWDHLRNSPRKADICAPLGMLHALARMGFIRFWVVNVVIGFLRIHPQMWNAPGWNDFEMGAWMVDHDPFYTARIYKRLYYTRGIVQETCAWMVNSVREQEPEFADQWSELNTGFPPPPSFPVRRGGL